jgi:hypothetical protein
MAWPRKFVQVRETCLLCFRPVLEEDRALDFLGLWMHRECFNRDQGLTPTPDEERRAA